MIEFGRSNVEEMGNWNLGCNRLPANEHSGTQKGLLFIFPQTWRLFESALQKSPQNLNPTLLASFLSRI